MMHPWPLFPFLTVRQACLVGGKAVFGPALDSAVGGKVAGVARIGIAHELERRIA